jgi:hypothetical protein
MPVVTATYRKAEDTFIVGVTSQQNYNYGNLAYILVGNTTTSSPYMRGLLRFNIPFFEGEIIKQTLRLNIQAQVGSTKRALALYKITEPQEDLWKEGTGNGAPDDYGATWNRYTLGRNWTIAGGDFDITKPICVIPIEPTTLGNVDLSICLDNLKLEAGTSNSFILILSNESSIGMNNYIQFNVSSLQPVDLILEIQRDEPLIAPSVFATPKSSTQIDISWDKPNIAPEEFENAIIKMSPTGAFAGEETTIATITDYNQTTYNHTNLVAQTDINLTNPKFDKWRNGRKVYYRVYWSTYPYGAVTFYSSIVNATTFKPMPAIKFILNPKSSHHLTPYADDNRSLKPYSSQILIEFLDEKDTIPSEQIASIGYSIAKKLNGLGWSSWVYYSAAFISMEEGIYTIPDDGYIPSKFSEVNAMDTGGLYRICTNNLNAFEDNFDSDSEYINAQPSKWTKTPVGSLIKISALNSKSSPKSMWLENISGTAYNTTPIPTASNLKPSAGFSFFKVSNAQPMYFRLTRPDGIGYPIAIDVSAVGLISYRMNGIIYPTTISVSNNKWYDIIFKLDFVAMKVWAYLYDDQGAMTPIIENLTITGWAYNYFDTMMFVSCLGGVYYVDDFMVTNYVPQTEIGFPAPCPVAIPRGQTRTSLPPDFLNTPSYSGDLTVDLVHAGQQIGEALHEEKFNTPLLSSVYTSYIQPSGGGFITQVLSYPTTDILRQRITNPVYSQFWVTNWIKAKDYDADPTKYNPLSNISKYTSSYHLDLTFRVTFGDASYGVDRAVNILFCAWSVYGGEQYNSRTSHGYSLRLNSQRFQLLQGNGLYNFPSLPWTAQLLFDLDLGANNPLHSSGYDQYIHIEIWVSPLFNNGLGGDRILVAYKRNASRAIAENIDWDNDPHIYWVDSINRWVINYVGMTPYNVYDQINYSGIVGFNVACPNITAGVYANIDWYKMLINGKVNQNLPSGSGYGAKDLTNDIAYPLKPTSPTTFPFYCEPDIASETIYIEGRIKNLQGAQSPNHTWSGRAGMDFQGGVINNAAPVAFLGAPKVGFVGSSVVVNCSQSIDPEGGDLIYQLDFGDTVALSTESKTSSHTYLAEGTYTIKLKVVDEAGISSAEVSTTITIKSALTIFKEITPMSPWTSISETSPTGTSVTPLAEVDYDIVQTMLGGNRVFSISGVHSDPDCTKTEAQRMASAEAERELFHMLKNQGALITLDLVFFGKIRGTIIDHNPSMEVNDQSAFDFSLTFQEIREEQFGE